jgi:hypothetical protein
MRCQTPQGGFRQVVSHYSTATSFGLLVRGSQRPRSIRFRLHKAR